MSRLLLAVILAAFASIANGGEIASRDKGWIAHNMGGSCNLGRGSAIADDADHSLVISALRNPENTAPPFHGETMLSVALFAGKEMQTDTVHSFIIVANVHDSSGVVIKPDSTLGISFLLGEKAEAALQLFEAERLIRVQKKDGSSETFVVGPKGFRTSKSMFDACVQSSKNA